MGQRKSAVVDGTEGELTELLTAIDRFRDYESSWDPDDPNCSKPSSVCSRPTPEPFVAKLGAEELSALVEIIRQRTGLSVFAFD